jgi:hypothetical protein
MSIAETSSISFDTAMLKEVEEAQAAILTSKSTTTQAEEESAADEAELDAIFTQYSTPYGALTSLFIDQLNTQDVNALLDSQRQTYTLTFFLNLFNQISFVKRFIL